MDTETGEVAYADMHCSGNQVVLLAPQLEKPSFLQTCHSWSLSYDWAPKISAQVDSVVLNNIWIAAGAVQSV